MDKFEDYCNQILTNSHNDVLRGHTYCTLNKLDDHISDGKVVAKMQNNPIVSVINYSYIIYMGFFTLPYALSKSDRLIIL